MKNRLSKMQPIFFLSYKKNKVPSGIFPLYKMNGDAFCTVENDDRRLSGGEAATQINGLSLS
ncbi:hypothetical protein [Sphingobacterium puteale]|uniref:hypothetical protein n=1 Tax=Sphingobacterium puteale TaxID=2420510 RepID=UPI003D9736CA